MLYSNFQLTCCFLKIKSNVIQSVPSSYRDSSKSIVAKTNIWSLRRNPSYSICWLLSSMTAFPLQLSSDFLTIYHEISTIVATTSRSSSGRKLKWAPWALVEWLCRVTRVMSRAAVAGWETIEIWDCAELLDTGGNIVCQSNTGGESDNIQISKCQYWYKPKMLKL